MNRVNDIHNLCVNVTVAKKNAKRRPSKLTRMQLLELVGLSSPPLTSTKIHDGWIQNYSPNRNLIGRKQHTHIFEILKEFADSDRSPKFLKKHSSFNKRSQKKVLYLQKKFNIKSDDWLNLYDLDRAKKRAMKEISEIEKEQNNHVYWYSLNLRGFLQYVIWAHDYGKIKSKKIDTIVSYLSQLTNGEDLSFLKYLEVFDLEYRKDIVIEISLALRSQLLEATLEHLRHYFILRCYEEISFWPAFEDNNLFYRLTDARQKNYITKLRGYKVEILKKLIPLEQYRLRSMEKDLKMTEESLLNP